MVPVRGKYRTRTVVNSLFEKHINMKEIEIKALLVEYLLKKDREITLGAEVPFIFGTRRADIISIKNETAIAFEIKSARDTTDRLAYQIESYKSYFDKCYIVCEASNLRKIRKIINKEIGLLVVENLSIKEIRKSKTFKRLNKYTLASTIPTSILKSMHKGKIPRAKVDLCHSISSQINLDKIRKLSRENLQQRYQQQTSLLKMDTIEKINSDDIITISRLTPLSLFR